MKKPTKFYSALQESSIANYLGLKVVSGSGARNFHPGDIISEDWLGECKTHTAETDKLVISKSVWNKIQDEADSSFRRPVLFIDNGTQNLKHTWCVFKTVHLDCSKVITYLPDSSTASYIQDSRTQVTFSHRRLQMLFELTEIKDGSIPAFQFKYKDTPLVIMKLEHFKAMIGGDD